MQDTGNGKIMTMTFVATAALVFLVVQVLFENFAGTFGPVARLHSNEALRHGLPIFCGLLTFAILQFTPRIRNWADECIVEIRKVVWPSRKDTVGMTVVCCVMVIVVGLILFVLDFSSQHLIKMFVSLNLFS